MNQEADASECWSPPFRRRIHWSLDSIAISDQSLVCHGWLYVPDGVVKSLELVATDAAGQSETLKLDYGLRRPDVAAAKDMQDAACGFFYHGGFQTKRLRRMQLVLTVGECEAARGALPHVHSVDLPVSRAGEDEIAVVTTRARQQQLARAIRMVFDGRWMDFWAALQRRVTQLRTPRLNEAEVSEKLVALREKTVLVIDHSLGGGANQFRRSLVRDRLQAGREVVLWTFAPAILQFQIEIYRTEGEVEWYRVAWSALGALLSREEISEVFLNNCVSFPQPERMAAVLTDAVRRRPVRLIILIHDFHFVCPSHFLLNDAKVFCGVPDISQCRKCLPAIDDQLASLFLAKDIDQWRTVWGGLLLNAAEVRCFSRSSVELLLRAYPRLREANVTVVPHGMETLPGKFQYPESTQVVDIGVAIVGTISAAKGSHVVAGLASAIRRHNLPLRLVVIGELSDHSAERGILQTGRYEPMQLADRMSAHGVHLALMPSVVAETFSYVTHELMQLGVPIACFSIGAQAEAVRAYPSGKILPLEIESEDLARELIAFKAELDTRHSKIQ